MPLSPADKIQILMHESGIAASQLREVKNEEMSWLKVFLIFYTGITIWSANRWTLIENTINTNNNRHPSDLPLAISILAASFSATVLFAFLMVRLRHSYYGVAKRMGAIQKQMGLYDPSNWDEHPPYSQRGSFADLESIRDTSSWHKATKPTSSFFTRILYITGAQAIVSVVCAWGIFKNNSATTLCITLYAALTAIALLAIVAIAGLYDYMHFTRGHTSQNDASIHS